MNNSFSQGDSYISYLSHFVIEGYGGDFSHPAENLDHLHSVWEQVAGLGEEQFLELVELAHLHHVTVRSLRVLEKLAGQQNKQRIQVWCEAALRAEKARIWKARYA
jgi:hypothetical protein